MQWGIDQAENDQYVTLWREQRDSRPEGRNPRYGSRNRCGGGSSPQSWRVRSEALAGPLVAVGLTLVDGGIDDEPLEHPMRAAGTYGLENDKNLYGLEDHLHAGSRRSTGSAWLDLRSRFRSRLLRIRGGQGDGILRASPSAEDDVRLPRRRSGDGRPKCSCTTVHTEPERLFSAALRAGQKKSEATRFWKVRRRCIVASAVGPVGGSDPGRSSGGAQRPGQEAARSLSRSRGHWRGSSDVSLVREIGLISPDS